MGFAIFVEIHRGPQSAQLTALRPPTPPARRDVSPCIWSLISARLCNHSCPFACSLSRSSIRGSYPCIPRAPALCTPSCPPPGPSMYPARPARPPAPVSCNVPDRAPPSPCPPSLGAASPAHPRREAWHTVASSSTARHLRALLPRTTPSHRTLPRAASRPARACGTGGWRAINPPRACRLLVIVRAPRRAHALVPCRAPSTCFPAAGPGSQVPAARALSQGSPPARCPSSRGHERLSHELDPVLHLVLVQGQGQDAMSSGSQEGGATAAEAGGAAAKGALSAGACANDAAGWSTRRVSGERAVADAACNNN